MPTRHLTPQDTASFRALRLSALLRDELHMIWRPTSLCVSAA